MSTIDAPIGGKCVKPHGRYDKMIVDYNQKVESMHDEWMASSANIENMLRQLMVERRMQDNITYMPNDGNGSHAVEEDDDVANNNVQGSTMMGNMNSTIDSINQI
ncbi:hypothetical protein Adt_24004 [Abeliophyllum distichum]|uniref:Uncharacterized protein n=1 Tax=Abeliophyllum distichum TaxID=126358 RepID=A0ABD1SCG3_9LAMI